MSISDVQKRIESMPVDDTTVIRKVHNDEWKETGKRINRLQMAGVMQLRETWKPLQYEKNRAEPLNVHLVPDKIKLTLVCYPVDLALVRGLLRYRVVITVVFMSSYIGTKTFTS